MRALGLCFVLMAGACDAEVIEEDDPNAAYRERYGDDFRARTVDEYCEATVYKSYAECDSERVCQSAWRRSEEVPGVCWAPIYEAWDCALEVTWEGCGERLCQDYWVVVQQCLTENGYFGTTSATTGGSDPSGGGGSASDGVGGGF